MTLSSLIHNSKTVPVATLTGGTIATQDTGTRPTVAKVASVTVANLQESENSSLSVVCYTPAGNPIIVQARDAEHAAFLLRVNPKPAVPLVSALRDGDDRRHCFECTNLSSNGRCLAVWRGEIEASSHYKPVDDLPRRCPGYAPKADDPNQRSGSERWPSFVNKR